MPKNPELAPINWLKIIIQEKQRTQVWRTAAFRLAIILGPQNLRLNKYRKIVFLLNLGNRDQQSTQKAFVKTAVMTLCFQFLVLLPSLAAVTPCAKTHQLGQIDCQGVSQLKTIRSSITKQIFYRILHVNCKALIHKIAIPFADL